MRRFSLPSVEPSPSEIARAAEPSLRNGSECVPIPFAMSRESPSVRRLDSEQTDDAKRERVEADKALLRACVTGGEAAFSALYQRLAPSLFSMVVAIVRNQKDAEDVLQEAFVQMWKRAASYDPERGNVFTWSVMIARNRAIDRVRALQRRCRLGEAAARESETSLPDPPKAADQLHSERDERARVRAALSQISDAQRVAIDLAFFSGLTQSEISAKLGTPLGTVKARIRRGLLALREELAAA